MLTPGVKSRRADCTERAQQRDGDRREQHAGRSTAGSEEQRLRQHIAHDSARTGAECDPQCQLLTTRRVSVEQQVGDVHARDEQNKRHRRREHHDHSSDRRYEMLLNGAHFKS